MNVAAGGLLELLVAGNLRVIALLAIVAVALTICGRQLASAARRNVWRIALIGCLVMPLLASMLPTLALPVLPFFEPQPTLSGTPSVVEAASLIRTRGASISPAGLLLLAYIAGVVLVAVRHGHSLITLRRFARTTVPWTDSAALDLLELLGRQLGIERKLELRASRRVLSAHTWGWRTTQIVLPAEAERWPGDRLRNVLVHEVCHVVHRDWLWLHVSKLIGAIYWFNPVVALAIRQHELETEKACDECVLSTGGNGADYAEHLVELMTSTRHGPHAGIALGRRHFRRRIRAILDFSKEHGTMSTVNARVVACIAAASILSLSTVELSSAQPAAEGQAGQPSVAPAAVSTESEHFEALQQESRRLSGEFNELEQALFTAFMRARENDRPGDGDAAAGLDERLERAKADLSAFMRSLLEISPDPRVRAQFERQLAARTDLTPEERSLERYNFELRAVVESRRAALERLEAPVVQPPE